MIGCTPVVLCTYPEECLDGGPRESKRVVDGCEQDATPDQRERIKLYSGREED